MYNILISAAAAVAMLLIMILVLKLAWWGSLIVAFIVFGLVFVLFSKITMKKVMASIETAGKDLQAQPPRFEKAIRELKEALQYGKWQIYVEGQINSQIGMIYYRKNRSSKIGLLPPCSRFPT